MKLQIVSDLHIETKRETVNLSDYVTPVGDVLVLAGDIGSMYRTRQLCNLLEQACNQFPLVIFVPGNHEYYKLRKNHSRPFATLENTLARFKEYHPNFYFLNRSTLQIENYIFIGATLWSQPDNFSDKIVRINCINKERFANMHLLDKKFITKQLRLAKKKELIPVVITHYPPVIDAVKETRLDDPYLSLYTNNLEDLLSTAKVWISGHTHNNYMKYKNNCLLVSNQLGKAKDNITDFSKRNLSWILIK